MRKLFTAGMAVHKFSLCFVCTDQWASGQQCMDMEVRKAIIPAWKCHENEEKIDNHDYVLRNYHRIKTTQTISMILVLFFLSRRQCFIWWNQNMLIFQYQRNENEAFRFFRTPRIVRMFEFWKRPPERDMYIFIHHTFKCYTDASNPQSWTKTVLISNVVYNVECELISSR